MIPAFALEFTPPENTFATISIIALVLLFVSFLFALKLKNLMGTGKDTAPVKILMTVIVVNAILGFYSATELFWKYQHDYVTHTRITDIMMLVIGIILSVSVYKVYKDYTHLLKKNEPNQ